MCGYSFSSVRFKATYVDVHGSLEISYRLVSFLLFLIIPCLPWDPTNQKHLWRESFLHDPLNVKCATCKCTLVDETMKYNIELNVELFTFDPGRVCILYTFRYELLTSDEMFRRLISLALVKWINLHSR